MRGIKKALGGALLASGLASFMMLLPSHAHALGWKAQDMIAQTSGVTELDAKPITQADVAGWVTTIIVWILGLAIVFFVLKVGLTAIDRMLFQNKMEGGGKGGSRGTGSADETVLNRIPFIGAYPQDVPWKEIWIHFGKNVGIVAGAWVLVNLVVNIVLWIFGSVTGQS